jgi:hypothetical protein
MPMSCVSPKTQTGPLKKRSASGCFLLIPAILATQEAENRRIVVWSQLWANISWDPILKKPITYNKKGSRCRPWVQAPVPPKKKKKGVLCCCYTISDGYQGGAWQVYPKRIWEVTKVWAVACNCETVELLSGAPVSGRATLYKSSLSSWVFLWISNGSYFRGKKYMIQAGPDNLWTETDFKTRNNVTCPLSI